MVTITVVLYFIPVRYLVMMWGINKFSRKLLRPDTVPNNELLDFLSRVPDDEDLVSGFIERFAQRAIPGLWE